jgi:hypothetical protein
MTVTSLNAPTEDDLDHAHIEAGKSAIYISNHAGACGILDVANTPIELATKALFNKKISIGCQACLSGDHDRGFFSKDHEHWAIKAGRWLAAEQIGDWGSVFITYGLQRHAPELMNGIGQAATYVAGDIFRLSANHHAQQWGKEHGYAHDAPEVAAHAQHLYSYEMTHLPQAIVWTASSIGLSLLALKVMGDTDPWYVNVSAKMAGAASTSLGVVALRALAPELASKWDEWGATHIAVPLTDVLTKSIGKEERITPTQDTISAIR